MPPAAQFNLLLIDEDETSRHALAERLSTDACRVREARGLSDAWQALREAPFSAVVCDLPASMEQGRQVLRRLLAAPGRPAIILLGPQDDLIDRVVGLEMGADDYMTRPVNPRELRARVAAVLRGRKAAAPVANDDQPTATYAFAGFRLDPVAETLRDIEGRLVLLPRGEYLALAALVERAGKTLSRVRLQALSSPNGVAEDSRAVDLRISRLRRRLKQAGATEEVIRTYYGRGYFLCAELA